MKVRRATKRWRRRPFEDRQLLGGFDPRVAVELQAIVDRTHSGMEADRRRGVRTW
jgi:hypothetical protein